MHNCDKAKTSESKIISFIKLMHNLNAANVFYSKGFVCEPNHNF